MEYLFIIIIAILLIVIRVIYEINSVRVKKYHINTNKLNNNLKIVFLSDLHNCTYGKDNKRISEKIRKLKPDYIIIGGDLIVGRRKLKKDAINYYKNASSLLKEIKEIAPVYYVFGNHETRVKNLNNQIYTEYNKFLISEKINIFNNEGLKNKDFYFYGFEMEEKYYNYEDLNEIKIPKPLNSESFNILCSHSPDIYNLDDSLNYDLILSGHKHGGTVRLPLIGGLISRDFVLFPKLEYGLYKNSNTSMIVSGGLGDHTIRFRFFNKPEIVLIDLNKNHESS